jgi:histidinol-phosphate aminotransferase
LVAWLLKSPAPNISPLTPPPPRNVWKKANMFKPERLIRSHIRKMPAYEPILPFEVLSEDLDRPAAEIIKLDANENPYGPLPVVKDALSELPYPHIYPDPESRQLREALSEFHHVPMENILVGAGADELIDLIMRLLIGPGDAILNFPPTFGMYSFDADLNCARVITIPRTMDFDIDEEAIENTLNREKPVLAFLAQPNNPDGTLLASRLIDRILDFPVIVVLDEAYIQFSSRDSSKLAEVTRRKNMIVLRTFSKWAGLAGLRVGYGIFPDELMPHIWKIKQPYNVSVAASAAACASLQNIEQLDAITAKIVAERQRLFSRLGEISYLEPIPSQANFILCKVMGRQAEGIKLALAQRGILVRYFNKPGLRQYIRISVGKPEHTDALIAALEHLEANS